MVQGKDSTWGASGSIGLYEGDKTAFHPVASPPKDVEAIAKIQSSLLFPHFTTQDIWALGNALRTRLLPFPTPTVISILLPSGSSPRVVFHTVTHTGTAPDNDVWVARKARTVFRFGVPTWLMHVKFEGNEEAFAAKYGLGYEASGYAIHGGAVPIRVRDVEGVVACVVVSGLKQHEDHGVVVEVLQEYLKSL